MGNCLVMEEKVIKIMRNDGEVVEYKGPMKVHHILTQFSNHYSLFESLSNTCHLHPQAKLLCGRLYYLMPKETIKIKKKMNKKVRFANPEKEEEEEERLVVDCGEKTKEKSSVGVLRVKMVVSKQELDKLLQGGSVHEMVYRSLAKQHHHHDDDDDDDDNDVDDMCHRGWRPLLDSIPESD